jgi:L-cysteine:1D-myo-inositol 2-amino-2-deoxy-alpha-D-glucopyranoside ligase
MQPWTSTALPQLSGQGPPLRLHDTAAGRVQPTAPGRTARMYVCGITPYDATHLGHAATYLAFDLVHRYWRDAGHQVHYVQNVTDVDDPLLERAIRDQDDWVVLGMRETALFREDMQSLRVLPPRDFVGAVEAIGEIVEVVAKLLACGAAYRVDDPAHPDVYFDHRAAPHFGSESRYDTDTMIRLAAERGGDPERPGKRHPLDALMWRTAREGEPSWDSELGPGRPGWHVECCAIGLNRLGTGFDVQGGGSDLIFPHHEFSAAHAEALTGQYPMARHYVHTAMIGLNGEKMSKSKGNLVFVSRLRADQVDPMALRLALLSEHYRTDRSWNAGMLDAAVARLKCWREAVARPAGTAAQGAIMLMRAHLADDLDTVGALAIVDAWATETLTYRAHDVDAPALMRTAVDALLGIAL